MAEDRGFPSLKLANRLAERGTWKPLPDGVSAISSGHLNVNRVLAFSAIVLAVVSHLIYIALQYRSKDRPVAETAMIHVRVEEDLKVRATEALAKMGMTVSEAVRVLLVRVVSDQAYPFPIKVPNAATKAAMESHDLVGPFATGEDLIRDLDANAGR